MTQLLHTELFQSNTYRFREKLIWIKIHNTLFPSELQDDRKRPTIALGVLKKNILRPHERLLSWYLTEYQSTCIMFQAEQVMFSNKLNGQKYSHNFLTIIRLVSNKSSGNSFRN